MPARASRRRKPDPSDPRLARFGRFIERAMNDAKARNLTVAQIEERTGVARSTIYRWIRGEVPSPRPAEVRRFCRGIGAPIETAAGILGWTSVEETAPEPPMDPDVLTILRRLADPNVPDEEKHAIRGTLRYLAHGLPRADDAS